MLPFVTLDRVRPVAPDHPVELTLAFGAERTGVVGANGIGKSTLLHVLAGARPSCGNVQRRGRVVLVRQSRVPDPLATVGDVLGVTERLRLIQRVEAGVGSDADLERFADDWDLRERIQKALGRLGVRVDPDRPVHTLSGGEATRVALAAALLSEPDLLLLDEPTDHLDAEGRAGVAEAVAGWRGGLVVVSHDRRLLAHVDRVLELSGLGARIVGGNYTDYRARRDLELAAAERTLAVAERERDGARRAARAALEAKAGRDAQGRRGRADGSQPAMVLNHWRGGAETSGARLSRTLQRQASDADRTYAEARAAVEIRAVLAAALPPSGLPPGRRVLRLSDAEWAPPGGTPLFRVSLDLVGPARAAVVGPNGSGKSTLLAIAAGRLAPTAGGVERPVPARMLDQRAFDLDPDATVLESVLARWPDATRNAARALLGRFLFPDREGDRRIGTLSGGQRARAALAVALGPGLPPPLLLLDEPTNHLDPETVEAVTGMLAGYDGALVVVSHDEMFLDTLGVEERIRLEGTRTGGLG